MQASSNLGLKLTQQYGKLIYSVVEACGDVSIVWSDDGGLTRLRLDARSNSVDETLRLLSVERLQSELSDCREVIFDEWQPKA